MNAGSLYFWDASLYFADFKTRKKGIVSRELLCEIVRLYIFERLAVREIADMVGISHMTVYRAISDAEFEIASPGFAKLKGE